MKKVIQTSLWFSSFATKKNLEGMTHEESLLRPEKGGASINWILGHIVATRNRVLRFKP